MDNHVTFKNVEPRIGQLRDYFVNTHEGRFMYTKGTSELHCVKAESSYLPKYLLKLDLDQTTVIKRNDAFKDGGSIRNLLSVVHD